MIQLTPIQLDDGTTIYIESNSDVDLPPTDNEIPERWFQTFQKLK